MKVHYFTEEVHNIGDVSWHLSACKLMSAHNATKSAANVDCQRCIAKILSNIVEENEEELKIVVRNAILGRKNEHIR